MRAGYHDLKRPEILELIPGTAKSILDLGCGNGSLAKLVKERQSCHVTGIELNKPAAAIAKSILDTCICDNLNRYDPRLTNKKYDCIILADILEHLISPWAVLKKFSHVLTENGTIVTSIPNVAHPWIISQLQKGLFRYELAGILDMTHLRFFTKTTIGQLFYKAGLKIKSMRAWPSDKNPIQYHITATKAPAEKIKPLVLILILTYNAWNKTKQCIASIKTMTDVPYRILVIDNGSTDDTIKELRKDNEILHIENGQNLGFAGGFNIGLELVDTPFFTICNSDIIVTKHWLERLMVNLNSDPKLLAIGPKSNYVSGPQIIKDCKYTTAEDLVRFASTFAMYPGKALTEIKRVVFFCTLFKKEALLKIGFLDEIFEKGNFEDDDYCMRIYKKGFKCAMDNTVFIHHWGSETFKQNKLDFKATLAINGLKFLKKWKFPDMAAYWNYLRK